jgi:ferredoxin
VFGPKTYRITLEPSGWQYDASADTTILRAALAAGFKLPSLCRGGTCRACMSLCIDGRVDYVIERPGLSPEEKADGWILPCVARPRSHITLDAPGARIRVVEEPKPIAVGPR